VPTGRLSCATVAIQRTVPTEQLRGKAVLSGRISEGGRTALLFGEFTRIGQAGSGPLHGADAEEHVAERPVAQVAELRNGLERAVRFELQARHRSGRLGGRVDEVNGMIGNHVDLRGLRDRIVAVNDHVHQQLDESALG